jgi:Ca2+-binding EF-hand superfamily protein
MTPEHQFKMIAAATLLAATTLAGGRAQAQDIMSFADTNMDGKVSVEEYKAFLVQGWMFIAMGADKVKLSEVDPMFKPAFTGVPVDAQGFVTEAAWNGSADARFKAADKNSDGSLNADELNASMAPA